MSLLAVTCHGVLLNACRIDSEGETICMGDGAHMYNSTREDVRRKTVPGGRVGILCTMYKSKVVIIRIVVGRMNSEP